MPVPWSRTRRPSRVDGHLDDAVRRRVARGVVEQVVDGAAEPLGDALDDHRGERGLERECGMVAPGARQRLLDDPVEPDILGQVERQVPAGELDQVADQPAQLLALLDDVGQQPAAVLLGRADRPARAAPRCSCAGS